MTSIGMFTYSTRPRGSVVHAAYLAEALTRAGRPTTLYALGKSGESFYRKVACRLRLIPAAAAPEDMDALVEQRVAEVIAGIDELRPRHDVFHAEDCLTASALLAAQGVLFDAPVVRTVHHVERYESPYLLACQRRSIERADLVLCVSEATRADVRREFGRNAPVVHNGVDTARFLAPDEPRIEAARRALGLHPGDEAVLSVGGVEPRKNSLRALAAMAKVLAADPKVHWIIAGGSSIWDHDPYRASFRAALEALPAADRRRVHVTGTVDDATLTAFYLAARVFLFPSEREGWGLAVLEAIAAGVPVVVPAEAPFTEYLDASSAKLVERDSATEIAAAVAELLADSDVASGLTRRAYEKIRSFGWEQAAARHADEYRCLLGTWDGSSRRVPASPLPRSIDDA